jgi:hypothetical protein
VDRPPRRAGGLGPPQARVVGLVECGTRALVDIVIGRYRDGESRLAALLVRSITPGMLLLADRNFPSVRLWRLFTKAGADLVWRAKEPVANRVVARLDDGSYLAKFGDGKQALTVRVIEYTLPGSTTIYRLLTSLLDPVMRPAVPNCSSRRVGCSTRKGAIRMRRQPWMKRLPSRVRPETLECVLGR